MRDHRAITDFEVLERSDRRVLTKYETTDTDLYEFAEHSELVVEFPIVAKRGWYEFDLTGTRDELDELAAQLDIDKSTASTVIRRAESRILHWFLSGYDELSSRR